MQTYLEYYVSEVSPKLQRIDIELRSGEDISVEKAAAMLDISEEEVEMMMADLNIKYINQKEFIKLMRYGSSYICQIMRRETELRSPFTYSPSDISYIYGFDRDEVERVCRELNISQVTDYTLVDVFANIY
jgi:hypothetical protein